MPKILKYLPTWPDVEGDSFKIALRPEPVLVPLENKLASCYETLRYVEYKMVAVYMNNVRGFAWILNRTNADIEVIDNKGPIAFKTEEQLRYEGNV